MNKIYNIYFTVIVISLFGFCPEMSNAQKNIKSKDQIHFSFPDDWPGYWSGTLDIIKNDKVINSLPMALDHAVLDINTYTWAIYLRRR